MILSVLEVTIRKMKPEAVGTVSNVTELLTNYLSRKKSLKLADKRLRTKPDLSYLFLAVFVVTRFVTKIG